MKTVIHVNQHRIRDNVKNGTREPVITVKDYKANRYGRLVTIFDKHGEPAAVVRYEPDNPLSCGARVWIETQNKVEVA